MHQQHRCSALRRQQQDRAQAPADTSAEPHWVQRLAAAGLAASIAASAALAPLPPLPAPPAAATVAATATRAEQGQEQPAMGMAHHSMQARPGTAAAE